MTAIRKLMGKVGLVDKEVYNAQTVYNALDFVTDEYNISTYLSLKDGNVGNPLSDPTSWRFLAKGAAATPAALLETLKDADGPGSGLDADTLDGTHLEDIVNPEEVASASPFDFFLGAKEVTQEDGTKKWVFQKMSPQNMATVAAGLMQANRMFPFVVGVAESPDSISKSGIYSYNDEATGAIVGYNWGIVVHFQNQNGWGTFQIATSNLEDKHLYFRKKINGIWLSWVQIV